MEYMTITAINGGYKIKDTVSNQIMKYYGYSRREAIQRHRRSFKLRYKHFQIIDI